jgi:ribonucleoside-diphosphate reductase alpha chain
MECISYNAINSSADLAQEKGMYPEFIGSNWSKGLTMYDTYNKEVDSIINRTTTYDWSKLSDKVKQGMRNGYLMAIAPTSSISIFTGTSQAIEPIYKRKWYEVNLSGEIPVTAPNLNPDTFPYYESAYDIDQLKIVKAGAIRQKWIDQGQSLNIFMRLDKASGKYLNEIYMTAWKLGLKSTYYLRSQSPEAINEGKEDRSIECEGCQ